MNAHGKLNNLVRVLRPLLYCERAELPAEAHLDELSELLREIPADDESIIGAEGHAIAHELRGELSEALSWREREIHLIELLHADVKGHDYDDATRNWMLSERDGTALDERREIAESLRRRLAESSQ